MNCSGVVAIAVLGLLLSNYKTAISSEATIFMEKYNIGQFISPSLCSFSNYRLWDMLTLIANTVIYLLTALV